MKRTAWMVTTACFLSLAASLWAADQYPVTGMVLKIDSAHKSFVVSCDAIPGYMDAMVMPFAVRDAKEFSGVAPGTNVQFTLVVEKESSYAEHIQVRHYQSVEQDPLTARRLKLLRQFSETSHTVKPLAVGEAVPDFALIDQLKQTVKLSQFTGKVVAINFIYTSCALPTFCFRITNNFGVLQKRFREQLGKDLVLLTVTFDPERDRPDTLAHYAKTWKADPKTWHFLTGAVPDVQHVTNLFGVDFFPDEGLMNHSLHTAVIDRQGKLVANIEGNQYTAAQLGDLVEATVGRRAAEESPNRAHLDPSGGSTTDK